MIEGRVNLTVGADSISKYSMIFSNSLLPLFAGNVEQDSTKAGDYAYASMIVPNSSNKTPMQVLYRDRNGSIVSAGSYSFESYEITNDWNMGGYSVQSLSKVVDSSVLSDIIWNKMSRESPYIEYRINSTVGGCFDLDSHTLHNFVAWYQHKEPENCSFEIVRDHDNKQYLIRGLSASYWNSAHVSVTQLNYDGNGNDKLAYEFDTTVDGSTIKYSYLQEENNKIEVTFYNGGSYNTLSKTISHIIPTLSGLTLTNDSKLINDPTVVSWTSTNQYAYSVWINGVQFATDNNNLMTYTLPSGSLKVGLNTISVMVCNKADANVTDSQVTIRADKTITLSQTLPNISSWSLTPLTMVTLNRDDDVVVNYEGENISYIEVYVNGVLEQEIAETGEYFSGLYFKVGVNEVKLVAVYKTSNTIAKVEYIENYTFIQNDPVIYNLEPADLNKNIEGNIEVTFETNEYVDSWTLKANNTTVKGTTERNVTLGGFVKGVNTLTLTCVYTFYNKPSERRETSKTVTFTGYGKPDVPVIDSATVYNTASPTLKWSSEEQSGYEYALYKSTDLNNPIKTGSASNTNHFVMVSVEDGLSYVFKVRIKNKYGLWSEYASKSFNVVFSNMTLPSFSLADTGEGVRITVTGVPDSDFSMCEVYRSYENEEEWVGIATNLNYSDSIVDYGAPAQETIEYKIRVYNTSGAYRETESKSINHRLINYWLFNTEDFTDSMRLDFVTSKTSYQEDIVYQAFANQDKPVAFFGSKDYRVVNLEVNLENEEALSFVRWLKARKKNTLLYRNWKGEKVYCMAQISSVEPVNIKVFKIGLQLTEVNFNEVGMYEGLGLQSIDYTMDIDIMEEDGLEEEV